MKRIAPVVIIALLLAIGQATTPASADSYCDWLGDPELIASCKAGGESPGHNGIPPEWLDYGKGWQIEAIGICPDGRPKVMRLLHWIEGDLFGDPVRSTDFRWRSGPGDIVPDAPRRSDGRPAVFAADTLVPDVAYCVSPLGGVDLGAEIQRRAPAGEPLINPSSRGLTGLDTWLWYEGGTTIPPFTLTVDEPGSGVGLEVEAWAVLESFAWDMGDGTVITSTIPGSGEDLPESAAAVHRYERKGDYTITFAVGWTGTYRWRQLPGGTWSTPIPFAGNPAVISTSIPYRVVELRSILQP